MESKKIRDLQRLTDLTNEFIDKFSSVLDPREYDMDGEYFINIAITAPSIFAAAVIDKASGTFHVDRKEILKKYIDKVELALRWVDHKNG